MANQQQGGDQSKERGGSGNFSNDPQRQNEPGRKGGQQPQQDSHGSGSKQQEGEGGRRSGSGNFANDPERASEAGQKGGEHSHKP